MDKKFNPLFLILLVAVAVLVYLYHPMGIGEKKVVSSENIKVSKFDISNAAGFPGDFPVESANIVDQSELDYMDRGVVLYNVSYQSSNQLEGLYNIYNRYFLANGYTIASLSKSARLIYIRATKGTDNVTVNISPGSNGSNMVSIAYTHKI